LSGRTITANEYAYDGDGAMKGFSLRNRETPWIHLEDVEFVE
jgi:hypothetical protein